MQALYGLPLIFGNDSFDCSYFSNRGNLKATYLLAMEVALHICTAERYHYHYLNQK